MGNNYRFITNCTINTKTFQENIKCVSKTSKKNYKDSSVSKYNIRRCEWVNEDDRVQKLAASVYEIKKKSGLYFKINKIGDYLITAAHCLDAEHEKQCVEDHDIAICNIVTGEQGNEIWQDFINRLRSGEFHHQIYQVNGYMERFKPGDSGLLCTIVNSKGMQHCELLDCGEDRVILVSGGKTVTILNGLLPKKNEYGSAGSVVNGTWIPRDAREMVFSGQEGHTKEMFGVKWQEFEEYSKITNSVIYPFHILNKEERIVANGHHQFPDLVTEKIYDLKEIKQVKVPKQNGSECHVFNLNRKVFSFHETDNRFIFGIVPAFETQDELHFKSGTPIFNVETNDVISCITKHYKNKIYAVSGIGWESGQIEKDRCWIGSLYHYVGKDESVYGNYHGPYNEVKKLAAAKAKENFAEKTGIGIYIQEKMVQIITYDENGKERWRVRLFHEDCKITDAIS